MRSSEHGAIPANIKRPQVWTRWVLQKDNTMEMYRARGERARRRRKRRKKKVKKNGQCNFLEERYQI